MRTQCRTDGNYQQTAVTTSTITDGFDNRPVVTTHVCCTGRSPLSQSEIYTQRAMHQRKTSSSCTVQHAIHTEYCKRQNYVECCCCKALLNKSTAASRPMSVLSAYGLCILISGIFAVDYSARHLFSYYSGLHGVTQRVVTLESALVKR